MALWSVSVSRIQTATRDIEVEADTREEAETKALDEAGDLDYSGCVVDYDFEVAGSTPVNGEKEDYDLPPGYRYLNMGETVRDTDKRWETPDQNPGMEAQWVEVPSVCIGETVDEPHEYIREGHSGEEVELESEEKRCPDPNGIVNALPESLCSLCQVTPFPGVSDEAIDAGWIPSCFIGEEEQSGPVCPRCAEQFIVYDPKDGEPTLVVNGEYVSVWDGGVEVRAKCVCDTRTRQISIEASQEANVELLDREYVLLNGKEYKACNEEEWATYTPEEQSRMFFWN